MKAALSGVAYGAALALMVQGWGCTAPASPAGRQSGADDGRQANEARHLEAPYVVLVSFDGFRHDYQSRFDTPNFDRLAARGLVAEGLVPVYPSKTFPGHYSIVTGMYPEHHGLTANTIWDRERDRVYRISDRTQVNDGSWYGGEPLWVTAERQGMRAASYFWVGSEADIGGVAPSYRHLYDGSIPSETRVDGAIEWLRLPEDRRPHFLTLYFSMVDDAGHSLGPESPEMRGAVEEADQVLGRLMDGLDQLPHGSRIYLVVVSDHGMMEVRFRDYIDLADFPGARIVDSGAHVSLFVEPDGPTSATDLRDALRAMLPDSEVYLRDEMPAPYNHRDNGRIGDVEVLVGEHRVVLRAPPGGPPTNPPAPSGGNHGYSHLLTDMRGILLAAGPAIRPGTKTGPVEQVDLYPWMAALLGLEPAAGIDGDGSVMRSLSGAPPEVR